MSFDWDVSIEIWPGIYRRLRECDQDELAAAMECQVLRRELRDQAEALLAEAAHHNIDVPQSLRDQLSEWHGGCPYLLGLVDALRDVVQLQPA